MACYPFAETDPFIIDRKSLPDILFAGNQPAFSSRLVKIPGEKDHKGVHQVRLICLPKFKETGTVVLCDISQKELPCYLLRFS
jgi:DNA polymerase II small subunit/DNA polymerase delta subunit B